MPSNSASAMSNPREGKTRNRRPAPVRMSIASTPASDPSARTTRVAPATCARSPTRACRSFGSQRRPKRDSIAIPPRFEDAPTGSYRKGTTGQLRIQAEDMQRDGQSHQAELWLGHWGEEGGAAVLYRRNRAGGTHAKRGEGLAEPLRGEDQHVPAGAQ